jgi:hypothetical protein
MYYNPALNLDDLHSEEGSNFFQNIRISTAVSTVAYGKTSFPSPFNRLTYVVQDKHEHKSSSRIPNNIAQDIELLPVVEKLLSDVKHPYNNKKSYDSLIMGHCQ